MAARQRPELRRGNAAARVDGVGKAGDILAQDTIRFPATTWRTSDIDHLRERMPGGEQDRLLIASGAGASLLLLAESGLWTGSEDELAQRFDTVDECLELAEDGHKI